MSELTPVEFLVQVCLLGGVAVGLVAALIQGRG
jgi:hypothetical protein